MLASLMPRNRRPAAGIVIARAVVRDLYEGVAAVQFFSRLMLVSGLAPILAPVLGGTLLSGGRVAVFGTLLGAAFVNIITAGLLQLRIGEFWIQACLGLMLLAAVLADRGRHVLLRRRGLV